MTKGRLPYFKFDVTSWLTGDIRLLTAEEQGVFINLCALIWRDKGEYRITKLTHRHMNMNEQAFNDCLHVLTDAGIVLDNCNILTVKFISEQLEEREEESAKKSKAGRISAEKRRAIQHVSTKEESIEKKEECREKEEKPTLLSSYELTASKLRNVWDVAGTPPIHALLANLKGAGITDEEASQSIAKYADLDASEKAYYSIHNPSKIVDAVQRLSKHENKDDDKIMPWIPNGSTL